MKTIKGFFKNIYKENLQYKKYIKEVENLLSEIHGIKRYISLYLGLLQRLDFMLCNLEKANDPKKTRSDVIKFAKDTFNDQKLVKTHSSFTSDFESFDEQNKIDYLKDFVKQETDFHKLRLAELVMLEKEHEEINNDK
jgi:hypothetical protein